MSTALVLREFVRNPLRMASVTPSSPALAATMTAPVPSSGEPIVVELGPGTGAFTAAVQQRLGSRGRHIAVDLNPHLAEVLAERFPSVEVVVAAAADLPAILADRGIATADAVVSGLPWAAFSGRAGGRLIDTIATTLHPAGAFTQFTYTWSRWATPSRRQHEQLRDAYDEVIVSRTIWRNVPPALTYVARRPHLRRS
ncbi:methyltransferase domain-containing protein [Pseudonocardia yuanmonensis]|uniref:Methyltransferase domain-containing protein n=1 Tax=Pseudonocardia yuanmonensis TaxID=1095914 RepID=A0ABP8XRX8_9PSEU